MKQGFTLMEILIVVAMIGILSYLAVPVSINFFRSQAVESARTDLIEILGRARHNALLQKGDKNWGVYIQDIDGTLSAVTLYKGNSYASRLSSATNDEKYDQVGNLSIKSSGSSHLASGDINFTKLTGYTNATGTLTINYTDNSESRELIIDDFGNAYRH